MKLEISQDHPPYYIDLGDDDLSISGKSPDAEINIGVISETPGQIQIDAQFGRLFIQSAGEERRKIQLNIADTSEFSHLEVNNVELNHTNICHRSGPECRSNHAAAGWALRLIDANFYFQNGLLENQVLTSKMVASGNCAINFITTEELEISPKSILAADAGNADSIKGHGTKSSLKCASLDCKEISALTLEVESGCSVSNKSIRFKTKAGSSVEIESASTNGISLEGDIVTLELDNSVAWARGLIGNLKLKNSRIYGASNLRIEEVSVEDGGEIYDCEIPVDTINIGDLEDLNVLNPSRRSWSQTGSTFANTLASYTAGSSGLPNPARSQRLWRRVLTRSTRPLLGFSKSVVSIVSRSDQSHLEYKLSKFRNLVFEKSTQAMPKLGVQYAWLVYRQRHSSDFFERSFLFVGRCLGFGVRIRRPLLIWLLAAAAVNLLLNIGNDCELSNWSPFIRDTLSIGLEPLSMIRGVSTESYLATQLSKTGWEYVALNLARVTLSIPLATAVLAIAKRARWDKKALS